MCDNDEQITSSVYEQDYIPYIIKWGKLTNLIAVILSFIPALICTFVYKLNPGIGNVIAAFIMQASISGIFWFVEPISYFPVLGIPATYMAFLSGNIGNLRLPASVAAQEAANVKPGTEKGTVIATIGVAVSIILNIAVLTIGVILGSSVLSMLPDSVVSALGNILPALFGAILAQQFIPNPKIGTVAVVLAGIMIALNKYGFLSFLPGYPVYMVIIVSVFGSIFLGRFMYNKGMLNND